jgi:hypothetical protein
MLETEQWNSLAVKKKDRSSFDRADALELHSTDALDALKRNGKPLAAATDEQEPVGRNR